MNMTSPTATFLLPLRCKCCISYFVFCVSLKRERSQNFDDERHNCGAIMILIIVFFVLF